MLCGSHIKIWNLKITWKKWNKEHQTLSFQFLINKSSILMFFVLFLHVVCEISNFNMWTTKHLAQGSCTELTLIDIPQYVNIWIILFLLRFVSRGLRNQQVKLILNRETHSTYLEFSCFKTGIIFWKTTLLSKFEALEWISHNFHTY